METRTIQRKPSTVVIPDAHQDAARRYIAVIVGRDVLAPLGTSRDSRTAELWDQFTSAYAELSTGGYARHGADALRIALGRI